MLRVRSAGGDVVLALTAPEAVGLTVAKVRAMVAEATSKSPQEVMLMDGAVVLKQTRLMKEVFASRTIVELQAIVRRLPQVDPEKPLPEQLAIMMQMLESDCDDLQQCAAMQLRKLLSKEQDPPINDIIAAGLVPKLVHALQDSECSKETQHDAAWALTNVASGCTQHVQVLIDEGTLPAFISKLSAADRDLQDQCVWGIGNIAGDSVQMRDAVLAGGAMRPLVALLQPHEPNEDGNENIIQSAIAPLSMVRNGTWALSNLCRHKPPPNLEALVPALEVLPQLLTNSDQEVLADACWAVSYLADGDNDRIEAVVRSGVCKRLVELLSHNSELISAPALRAVGNILSGEAHHTQALLQCGAVQPILQLLANSPKAKTKKEACWSMSNITAGTEEQIQVAIDAGLAPVLHELEEGETHVRKEAAWVISNAFTGGSPKQAHIVAESALAPLLTYLQECVDLDIRVAKGILDAVKAVLDKGATLKTEQGLAQNPLLQILIENDCEDLCTKLMSREDDLAEKAREILQDLKI